jgi:tight adherence protein B
MSMISVFLIILVAVFATLAYFTEPTEEDKRLRERLVGLDRRHTDDDGEQGIMRRVTFSSIPSLDQFLRNHKLGPKMQLMLEQAKLPWTVGRFFFFSALMVVVGAALGNWWIKAAVVAWAPGVAAGFVPLLCALYKRSARFRRFNLQLPDAIDFISRALRAGHALPATLVLVADEMADPLGTEFRRTADELNYGLPFREALLNLNRRFPVRDLQFMVSAILVQKETGGNLAELLDKTAAVLRSRLQLQQKVKVHTAQGRMTGAILFALPFLCFLLLNVVKPGYGDPLFENEVGRKMIYGTLVSMTIGALVIRRIVRVKY